MRIYGVAIYLGIIQLRVYGGVDEMNLGVRFTVLVYSVYI